MLVLGVLCYSLCFLGCGQPDSGLTPPKEFQKSPPASADHGQFEDLQLDAKTQPRDPDPEDWFADITEESGVEFQHRSGRQAGQYTMLEGLGSGVGLLDYDQDGDLDLYCVGGGSISPDRIIAGRAGCLYRNDGNFRFVNVTSAMKLDKATDYAHGVAIGDVNNDQYPDMYITCYGNSSLYLNQSGKYFSLVDRSITPSAAGWSSTACFGDVNRDGLLDLFVVGYLDWKPGAAPVCHDPRTGYQDVCAPSQFPPWSDSLFLGQPDGTFENVSESAGLKGDGKGLGILADDLNGDGNLDFYVANDVTDNFLYWGNGDGTFREEGMKAGVAGNEYGVPEGSMGVTSADVDRDGLMDLFCTNFEIEENSLYRNESAGLFLHSTYRFGLGGFCKAYVGFGTAFADFDLDGWEDLVVVNGHLIYRNRLYDYQQPAFLFYNQEGNFQDASDLGGPWFSVPHSGRGLAIGDLDNNGTPDIVVSEQDGPVSLLQNLNKPNGWLGIHLIGEASGIDAVGASAKLTLNNGTEIVQNRSGGGSYLSSSDPRLLFAWRHEDSEPVRLEVTWPSGLKETFPDLPSGRYHTLQEGTGQ